MLKTVPSALEVPDGYVRATLFAKTKNDAGKRRGTSVVNRITTQARRCGWVRAVKVAAPGVDASRAPIYIHREDAEVLVRDWDATRAIKRRSRRREAAPAPAAPAPSGAASPSVIAALAAAIGENTAVIAESVEAMKSLRTAIADLTAATSLSAEATESVVAARKALGEQFEAMMGDASPLPFGPLKGIPHRNGRG
jgi:hypothetical protein